MIATIDIFQHKTLHEMLNIHAALGQSPYMGRLEVDNTVSLILLFSFYAHQDS